MEEEKIITLNQNEINRAVVWYLQDLDKIDGNIHVDNIYIREEGGEIKCTVKG